MSERAAPRPRAIRRMARWMLIAVVGGVAACESAPDGGETTPAGAPPEAGVVMPAVPNGTAAARFPGADAGPAADGAALAIRTTPPEPIVDSDPRRLLELEPEALTDLLGQPSFVRDDDPAQLWRYRGESCRLDLFLYDARDRALGKRYTVRHYTARSEDDSAMPAEDCLRRLLLARMRPPAG